MKLLLILLALTIAACKADDYKCDTSVVDKVSEFVAECNSHSHMTHCLSQGKKIYCTKD